MQAMALQGSVALLGFRLLWKLKQVSDGHYTLQCRRAGAVLLAVLRTEGSREAAHPPTRAPP